MEWMAIPHEYHIFRLYIPLCSYHIPFYLYGYCHIFCLAKAAIFRLNLHGFFSPIEARAWQAWHDMITSSGGYPRTYPEMGVSWNGDISKKPDLGLFSWENPKVKFGWELGVPIFQEISPWPIRLPWAIPFSAIAPLRMRLLGCSNYFTGADSGPGPKSSTKNLLWKAWLKPCWFTKNLVYFMETCGGFLESIIKDSRWISPCLTRKRGNNRLTHQPVTKWGSLSRHKIGVLLFEKHLTKWDIPWLNQIPIVKHRVFLIIYYWLKSIYPV